MADTQLRNSISDLVLQVCAMNVALATKGISGMANVPGAEIFGKQSPSKGIKISYKNEKAVIDAFVIVEYGFSIPEVSWELQENIKKNIEELAEVSVGQVNIHIQGVSFDIKD